jgi:hypothetical protein
MRVLDSEIDMGRTSQERIGMKAAEKNLRIKEGVWIHKNMVRSLWRESIYSHAYLFIYSLDKQLIYDEIKKHYEAIYGRTDYLTEEDLVPGTLHGSSFSLDTSGCTEWFRVIYVNGDPIYTMYENTQVIAHEMLHAAIRTFETQGVTWTPDCHEHLNLLHDDLCRNTIPHVWEWMNMQAPPKTEEQ